MRPNLAPGWPEGIFNLGCGIWDLKRETKGFAGSGAGDFEMGVGVRGAFYVARREVGFLQNSLRGWRSRVAKLAFAKGSSHEETGGFRCGGTMNSATLAVAKRA